ncbi:MAG: HAMP domain-containing protein [Bacteroidetes bacterium]|nr:HAMP domain-containing protein [Bacteroidota bacterium]
MTVILITCAIVLTLMCSAYMVFEYISFRNVTKVHVSTIAAVVASNSSAALAFDSQKDGVDILSALSEEKHIVAASLYKSDGKIFAKFPVYIQDSSVPSSPGEAGFYFSKGFLEGFQPVVQNGKILGMLYLKSDMQGLYEQLRHFAAIAFFLIASSLLIAYFLSHILQKSISQPILQLEETARRISEKGDYSVRAKKHGNDELGALTNAFNFMLSQIEVQNKEILSFNHTLERTVEERTLELVEANSVLRQQKEFVETIINSSVDIIGVFDAHLNYVMINKRVGDFDEYKRDEIVGKNILEVFPDLSDSAMYKNLQMALKGEIVHDKKYKSPIVNRYFENYYIPLMNELNEVYGVLVIGHDISDIMEANEKLESVNSALVKSNQDLEQFAYIASHDLQEPLRKIQTFSQLIIHDRDNTEMVSRYLEKINSSANRMQQLIQEVLNFSRISRAEEAFVPVDLNKTIESLLIDFELLIREKKATINFSGLPVIRGIPLQLSQLFSNLMSNSLKYTERDPLITISCRDITSEELNSYPDLNQNSSYICISVEDNGIGFDPQFNEKIFSIFQRLHDKQSYSGTGIGLALCKKIVENHGGKIEGHGKVNNGSRFNVILPVR